MLGHLTLSAPKTSSTFLNNLGGNINGDINGLITDFAKTLKIHDFYSAHILDYCEVNSHPLALLGGENY